MNARFIWRKQIVITAETLLEADILNQWGRPGAEIVLKLSNDGQHLVEGVPVSSITLNLSDAACVVQTL